MTGDSRTDLTRAEPDNVNNCSVYEQITEQTAAFKTDEIFENKDDMVSHEIMVIDEPSFETQKANIKSL